MLTTFLLVSYHNLNRFDPSRVSLACIGAQTLETDLEGPSKQLGVKVAETSPSRSAENTLGVRIRVRLLETDMQLVYIPFSEGATRLLELLQPKISPRKKLDLEKAQAQTQKPEVSQIRDEASPPSSAPLQNRDEVARDVVESNQHGNQEYNGHELFDSPTTTAAATSKPFSLNAFRWYEGNWSEDAFKPTISQIQFWLIKGLDVSQSKEGLLPFEIALIGHLLDILLLYLEPPMYFIVKPILEAPEGALYVWLAQRCDRVFRFLKKIAETPIESTPSKAFRELLRLDWFEMLNQLDKSNRELIDQNYELEKQGTTIGFQKATHSSPKFVSEGDPLIRYERSSSCEWILEHEIPQPGLLSTQASSLSSEKPEKPDSKAEINTLHCVFIGGSDPNQEPPKELQRLPVNFGPGRDARRGIRYSNKSYLVHLGVPRLTFVNTQTLAQMQENKFQSGEELEVNSSEVVHSFELINPIWIPNYREASRLHWRLLQQGMLQLYLPGEYWEDGYTANQTTCNCTMQYVDLSDPTGSRVPSKFDLTAQLFSLTKTRIDNHSFSAMGLVTSGENEFFIAILESGNPYGCRMTEKNLFLAQFAVKDKQLVLQKSAVFSITLQDYAMLETESRDYGFERGLIQWLRKRKKCFSITYLTGEKQCVWVHVFHNRRFFPIGSRNRPIPGLTQLGMYIDLFVTLTSEDTVNVAFGEKRELLSRKKTSFRVFSLTPKW